MRNAEAIRNDPAALANLGLITTHGFALRAKCSNERRPNETRGVRILREARWPSQGTL